MLAAAVLIAGLSLIACGGSDDGAQSTPVATQSPAETSGGDGQSVSSVAPDTFLIFQEKRYRLVDLEQANLVDRREFEAVGTASEADIDQADLTVYQRTGDADAIYTYAEPRPESEALRAVEGEDATTPALWYRWVLDE